MRQFIPENAVMVPDYAKKVFEGVIFDVYQWPQKMFDGSIKTFEMLQRTDLVNILAVHEGKILVNEEEQPYLGSYKAMPGGMHEMPDEDECEAARRELEEETGYRFHNWKLVRAIQINSRIESFLYTFLATDLDSIVPAQNDVGERIIPTWITFEELKAMKQSRAMRYYPAHVLDDITSLDELLALPSLHSYK